MSWCHVPHHACVSSPHPLSPSIPTISSGHQRTFTSRANVLHLHQHETERPTGPKGTRGGLCGEEVWMQNNCGLLLNMSSAECVTNVEVLCKCVSMCVYVRARGIHILRTLYARLKWNKATFYLTENVRRYAEVLRVYNIYRKMVSTSVISFSLVFCFHFFSVLCLSFLWLTIATTWKKWPHRMFSLKVCYVQGARKVKETSLPLRTVLCLSKVQVHKPNRRDQMDSNHQSSGTDTKWLWTLVSTVQSQNDI